MIPLKLFEESCVFKAGAQTPDQLPPPSLKEVAFVGRSNVGKSSLINALVHQKNLARTSKTPGRTQQINFFELGRKLFLVDLPGYGYAKIPPAQRQNWDALMAAYFNHRSTLQKVCLLIDGRHPLKDSDREMMSYLDRASAAYAVVLTKIDAVKPAEIQHHEQLISEVMSTHPLAYRSLYRVSAEKNQGLDPLRGFILS